VDHFDWFSETLSKEGYLGVYKQRPEMVDGSAIFFKTDRFRLVEYHGFDYNALVSDSDDRNNMYARHYFKNNVGIFALLEFTSSTEQKQQILVATTHTYWDPQYSDLKVRQAHMLLQEIEKFLGEFSDKTPIVVAGDFNSEPSSAVYQLYSQGRVSGSHSDMLHWPADQEFSQNFLLKSAYAALGEPATNCTPWFKGAIDYIWYSSAKLELSSLLDMLSSDQPLPSADFSSDHAALCCELNFKSP